MVVLLAGGYGNDAWRYPARFLSWLAAGRVLEPPDDEEVVLQRLRRVFHAPPPRRPADDRPFELSAEDLPGLMPAQAVPPARFLGLIPRHAVELLLERSGILERLRVRGYRHLRVQVELGDPIGDTLRVVANGGGEDLLLLELRVRRDRASAPGLELVSIEWLLLQDPRGSFTPHRPRLPGQRFPGLGLLKEVLGLLLVLCESHRLDGIAFRMAHYHVAVLGRRLVRGLRPEDEAQYRAFADALAGLSLAEAARAVEEGRLLLPDGSPVRWRPALMAVASSDRLRARIEGPEYEAEVESERAALRLRLTPQ
jgi:hypothetical protein